MEQQKEQQARISKASKKRIKDLKIIFWQECQDC
jgi:hypothetical protein